MRFVGTARPVLLGLSLSMVVGFLLIGLPGTARADVLVHRDPVGDVARSPVGSNVYSPVPTQAHGDIVATRVVHARLAIWIQIRFRELTDRSNGNFHLIGIRTPWRSRTIELDALPGHWEGTTTMTNGRGQVVACAVTHRISYDRNRVMLRVPRNCLGAPRWVQVAIRSTVAGATFAYADDAWANGLPSPLQSSLVYGRRLPL